MMFYKKRFLAIIQHHNSGQQWEIDTMFHIWSDTELVTVILALHFETMLIVEIFCAAG